MIRGCGERKPGGLYICTELSPGGTPIEHFIIDPPIPYDGQKFRVPTIFEKDGINHLLFWVGKEFYDYPSDFIEEARRFGCSKRVPAGFPIEKLQYGSMMFFVHSRAIIEDFSRLPKPQYCPKNDAAHYSRFVYCIGHSYTVAPPNSESMRNVGDTAYKVYPPDSPIADLQYKPGIFLRMPITNIDHVLRNGQPNPEIAKKQSSLHLPLNFKKE